MRSTTRTVFTLLSSKAVSLIDAKPHISTIQYLTSISASFTSLCQNLSDKHLLQCSNECIERLSLLLPQLPTGDFISDDVVVNIFRISKNSYNSSSSNHHISQSSIIKILIELDERLTGAQIALWKPSMIIASLHALAKSFPTAQLNLIDILLFCAKENLNQMDERRTVRLLWCIATMKQEIHHASLWSVTCRRLIRFAKLLNYHNKTLLIETLMLVPECICEAQQELLCILQENRLANKESGEIFDNEEGNIIMGNDYEGLKLRLFSDIHLLPIESIIRMLLRAHTTGSSTNSEEVHYMLQYLLYRPIKLEICRPLLEIISIMECTDITETLRNRVIECIRNEARTSCVKGEIDPIYILGTISIAAAIERKFQPHGISLEIQSFLEEFIIKCHDLRDNVWRRYSGKIAGTISIALDLLNSCNYKKENSTKVTVMTGVMKILEKFPSSWEQSGVAVSVVTECALCVTSTCELLQIPPLLHYLNITNNNNNNNNNNSNNNCGFTDVLLQRCTETLERFSNFIPSSFIFDIWRKAARVVETRPQALQPLMKLLLNYAEQHPREFSLKEVTKFLATEKSDFPAEAFELFIQCLRNEGNKNIMPFHFEILVTSLETVAARGDKLLLERLQLLLFLRPLGYEKGLIQTIKFSISHLVRLYHCCNIDSDVTASMQATLLELIINACPQCTNMIELNTAASLLLELKFGDLKDALVWAIVAKAKIITPEKTPDVQKALLVVYLHKAGIVVEESLLTALRRRK